MGENENNIWSKAREGWPYEEPEGHPFLKRVDPSEWRLVSQGQRLKVLPKDALAARTGETSFVMLFARINDGEVVHEGSAAPGKSGGVRESLEVGGCLVAREEGSHRSSGAEF